MKDALYRKARRNFIVRVGIIDFGLSVGIIVGGIDIGMNLNNYSNIEIVMRIILYIIFLIFLNGISFGYIYFNVLHKVFYLNERVRSFEEISLLTDDQKFLLGLSGFSLDSFESEKNIQLIVEKITNINSAYRLRILLPKQEILNKIKRI